MPKFSRLLHYSLNLCKLFIHRMHFLNIFTYLPIIRNRLATGSILAITFGILLVFSLIATGYLFFSHRRSRSPKQSKSVTPFQDVGYNPLEPTPQGLLQPTPMQSSNFRSQAINPEVISVNVSHPLVSKMLRKSLTISGLFLMCSPNPRPSLWIGNTDQT